jgi:hypothetical protein
MKAATTVGNPPDRRPKTKSGNAKQPKQGKRRAPDPPGENGRHCGARGIRSSLAEKVAVGLSIHLMIFAPKLRSFYGR